jgi:hypothetical protein
MADKYMCTTDLFLNNFINMVSFKYQITGSLLTKKDSNSYQHAVSTYFLFGILVLLRLADTCELAQQQNREDGTEQHPAGGPIIIEHYRLGYQECLSEAMHFLVEVEGFFAGDPLCVQLINHLQKHCDKILRGERKNES